LRNGRPRGLRTNKTRELDVHYARDGDEVWIVPGHAGRKRWWRNMADGWPVSVCLAGRQRDGTARVVRTSDEVARGFAVYHAAFPRTEEPEVMVPIDLAARAEPPSPAP